MRHEAFLRVALEQAQMAVGQCAPNPSVGAVAVRDDQVLATGFHEGPGTLHAEQVVLAKLPVGLSDITLYVTLEPCNHWGRTPPCVDAIIQAGVKRVVYGFTDCNPIVVERDTPHLLREKNIEVIFFPLPEITQFYESYAYWVKHKRPKLSMKLALSLDGKIAGTSGRPIWLSNEVCAQFTHEQRQRADWILTSAQTVIRDNPRLTVRLAHEVGKNVAIIDRNLRVPPTAQLFEKAKKVIVFYDERLTVEHPHPRCEYVPTSTDVCGLNLKMIVDYFGEVGVHDVWAEVGGGLFTAFHLAGLVQRTFLYQTPHVLGEDAVHAYRDKTIFQRQHSVSWRVLNDNVLLTLDWNKT